MEVRLDNINNNRLKGIDQVDGYKTLGQKSKDVNKLDGVEIKSPMLETMSLLKSIPEVRMDKVVLARKLIADSHYPDTEVLDKVADALLGANSDNYDE